MTVAILTNRQALAAINDGASVYYLTKAGIAPIADGVARGICQREFPGVEDSPFATDPEGDLYYLGRTADSVSRNFKRLCERVEGQAAEL